MSLGLLSARLAKLEKASSMREDIMSAAAEQLRASTSRLEPEAGKLAEDVEEDLHPNILLASMAISLKRIADSLRVMENQI